MPHPLRRRTLLTAGAGACVLQPGRSRAEATNVAIAVSSTSFVLGGVLIGMKSGVFERRGLAPRIILMDSGNAAMAALLGGSAQFAVAGPPETLAARSRGQDVLIVANLYAGFAGLVVLGKAASEHSGVAPSAPLADRLHALDNLLMAVPSATSSLLGPIRDAAAQAGAHVRFTYMAQGTMPAALESDAVQGIDASLPFSGVPLLHGTGVLWINGPAGELPADVSPASSSCLMTSADYLKSHREIVGQLQTSIVDIAGFIKSEPEAAKRALAAGYPQLGAEEIDLAFTQQWRNWTKPFLTGDDMRQEKKLLLASTKLPGLETMDPATALVGQQ
jgi:ABC-type nitrate/sulfonate/bicarbonate transport system substrate-binding protein